MGTFPLTTLSKHSKTSAMISRLNFFYLEVLAGQVSVVSYAAEKIRFSFPFVIGVVSALGKGKKTVGPGRVIIEKYPNKLMYGCLSQLEDVKKSLC